MMNNQTMLNSAEYIPTFDEIAECLMDDIIRELPGLFYPRDEIVIDSQ